MMFLHKTARLCISMIVIFWATVTTGWTYPIKQVSKPEVACKVNHRSTLDNSCKVALPIIKNSDYSKYIKNNLYRAVYSDIRGGSYHDGWDTDFGGAPSTDIATAEWTPVYAIGKGKVIVSQDGSQGYGNTITIEHDLWEGKKIWSSYSHLSSREVEVGDLVEEDDPIGKVGKSWFTIGQFGYHLDFAITTTKQKSYPYSYGDCPAGYMNGVQKWVCRDYLVKNTIDPILFLELNGDLNKTQRIAKTLIEQSKAKEKALVVTKVESSVPKTTTTFASSKAKIATINQKSYKIKRDDFTIEIVDLYKADKEALGLKKKAYVTVVILKDGKPYTGFLRHPLQFVSQYQKVGVTASSIDYIVGWEQTVILYGDKKWDDTINVKWGSELLGVHQTKVND